MTDTKDGNEMQDGEKWCIVSGDGKRVLLESGCTKFFERDAADFMASLPDVHPVLFDTREEAEAEIRRQGYNQFTRVTVWEM